MSPVMHWFETNNDLAPALAVAVANDLRAALALKGVASLLVSGGRSPVPVFEALRNEALDWSNVTISLVDERWVDESDSASNASLVKHHLLKSNAAAAKFIPLYNGCSSASEAERAVSSTLENALSYPIAAVILGMGDDGHTASLFPDSPSLNKGLGIEHPGATVPACLAQTASVAPMERISFTLPWLLNSRNIYLQFSGASKLAVFESAQQQATTRYPVSYFLHQKQIPVHVYASKI